MTSRSVNNEEIDSTQMPSGCYTLSRDSIHSTIGEILTPAQLKRELRRISWGNARLAEKLGVWPTEVRDWLLGKTPVPEVVASDIRRLPTAT